MTNEYKAALVDGYEVVIGLEIHCQLNTQSKIFSSSPTAFGSEPNTQANEVDLALPGVLPVLNESAVDKAILFGLGIDAKLGKTNIFARKNYFYPDLPKGYQTSQMDDPIVGLGHIDIEIPTGQQTFATKRIGVTRAHLEEDAGKSLHDAFDGMTGIDLNRAGTPLLEIVSEPDMRSTVEALAYVKKMHALVRWIGISDGNMAEGSFRCDCNVSVRKPGAALGTRCELKNLNSFRFIERAIDVEIERQIDLIEDGGQVIQETRLFDTATETTRSMRSKEEANDYRYFPCPDLLPVVLGDERIERVKDTMPELPAARHARYETELGLSTYDASVLTGSRELADYYDAALSKAGGKDNAKLTANWVMGELLGALNKTETDIENSPISPAQLGGMLARITDNTISGKIAKQVFAAMLEGEGGTGDDAADKIISDKGLKQETDEGAITTMIQEVLAANQQMVDEYKGGKEKAFNGLVGQVMKASRGKANPAQVNQILKKLIG